MNKYTLCNYSIHVDRASGANTTIDASARVINEGNVGVATLFSALCRRASSELGPDFCGLLLVPNIDKSPYV